MDYDTVAAVLEAMGPERVESGMAAFGHNPRGEWCMCFATGCFRNELANVPAGKWPRWKGSHELLDSDTIAARLNLDEVLVMRVFEYYYEDSPDELRDLVVDWLAEQGVV